MGLALSKQPPTTKPQSSTMEDMREMPALAPVFEGQLYLRTENKQWQLRLFRFDGTAFTCLSTRKVKLPPGTRLDPSVVNLNELVMNRSSSASVTSPLLATLAKNSRVKADAHTAGYYQLPKWTVNVADIAAISVLKNTKKRPFLNQKSHCFCIRTHDDRCYVLKAQKEKDLERWLFILTKMWNFATALRSHLETEPQSSPERNTRQLPNDDDLPLAQTVSPETLAIITSKDQLQHSSNMNSRPLTPISTPISNVRKLVPPLPLENYGGLLRTPGEAGQAQDSEIYEQRYQMPQLSEDKLNWIDAWRNSLAELVASDPEIKLAPPVIEPIKDDDIMSIGSEMTSITTRARLKAEAESEPKATNGNTISLRRRVTGSSRHSVRKASINRRKVVSNARLNMVGPAPEISPYKKVEKIEITEDDDITAPKLQRKRSNDVKNWIEPDRIPTASRLVRNSSHRRPTFRRSAQGRPASSPEVYSLNYFQPSSPSEESESNRDANVSKPGSGLHEKILKYHSSVRGKTIQLVQPSEENEHILVKEVDVEDVRPPSRSSICQDKRSSAPIHSASRLHTQPSSSSLRSEQMISNSPLTNVIANNGKSRRSSDPRSLEVGGQTRRQSSADDIDSLQHNNMPGSTLAETQQRMWQQHYQMQQQQQAIAAYQYPMSYGYSNMPSLVSPAIPPMVMSPTLMSSFPRSFGQDMTQDTRYVRSDSSSEIRRKQKSSYYALDGESREKKNNDTTKFADELSRLQIHTKASAAGSDVSTKSRRPESWVISSRTSSKDYRDINRRSMDSFKLLDQRTPTRQ